jgi:hypothetical protein
MNELESFGMGALGGPQWAEDAPRPGYEVLYLKSKTGPFNVRKFMTFYQAKEYLDDLKKDGMNGKILRGMEIWKIGEDMNTEIKVVDQFDHEQDIMACWHIVDDIDQLLEMIMDRDASKDNIANVLAGLSVLYGDRFAKLHDNFEKLLANKEIY